MSTKEKKPRRTLAQLITSILPWYVPRSFSLVKPCWVTAMLGNGGGRWNTGSKDSYTDRSTYPTAKTPGRDNRELAPSDNETKKPLDSQGNQGFSLIGPAGFEPTTSTTPTKRTTPSGPTKTKAKRKGQVDGCTNGCTCDRCLLELADALKRQLSNDERRKLAVLLLQ